MDIYMDAGGRRSGVERRCAPVLKYHPEKRRDLDRRSGLDRRRISKKKYGSGYDTLQPLTIESVLQHTALWL